MRRKALGLLQVCLVSPFPRAQSPSSTILGRSLLSMYLEDFEMVEEVALQRLCLAIKRATRIFAWVRPDPPGLERRGIAFVVR